MTTLTRALAPSTARKRCTHMRGDFFHGMWICADCYKPLDGRPVVYSMGFADSGNPRQEIAWQAEIATDAGGTTFASFLRWMTGYLRRRSLWTISKDEARAQCLEALRDQGEPFGSDGACWDREDAKEIVQESICAYWDEAPAGGSNA